MLEGLRIKKFQLALCIQKTFYSLLLFCTTLFNSTKPNLVPEEKNIIRIYTYGLWWIIFLSALFSFLPNSHFSMVTLPCLSSHHHSYITVFFSDETWSKRTVPFFRILKYSKIYTLFKAVHIYIYIYVCVCVCVCECRSLRFNRHSF